MIVWQYASHVKILLIILRFFVCVHHLYNDSSVYKAKKSVYSSMLSYKNKWFEGLKSETVIFVWGVLIIHLKKKKSVWKDLNLGWI